MCRGFALECFHYNLAMPIEWSPIFVQLSEVIWHIGMYVGITPQTASGNHVFFLCRQHQSDVSSHIATRPYPQLISRLIRLLFVSMAILWAMEYQSIMRQILIR